MNHHYTDHYFHFTFRCVGSNTFCFAINQFSSNHRFSFSFVAYKLALLASDRSTPEEDQARGLPAITTEPDTKSGSIHRGRPEENKRHKLRTVGIPLVKEMAGGATDDRTRLLWVFLWQCLSWLLWGVRTKQSASILPQKFFALRGPGRVSALSHAGILQPL